MTAPSAPVPLTVDVPRIQTVIDAFDTAQRTAAQRAAAEDRLTPVTAYTFAELLPRASLVNVVGGVIGFFTFLTAVPLVVTNVLARTHQAHFQLQGFAFGALILVNLGLGYAMLFAHEALHAAVCRLLGGTPTLLPASAPTRVVWSAGAQGFSRASYAAVLLAPLVIVAALWLIILAALPPVAAFLVVPAAVNAVMAGADLWSLVVALRQPTTAVVFQDQHPGFIAYAIAAPKPAPKKPITRPVRMPASTTKPPLKKPVSAKTTPKKPGR